MTGRVSYPGRRACWAEGSVMFITVKSTTSFSC